MSRWVGKFFYLLELLLESPRPTAHVLAARRLWCGRLGGSTALGEVGHDGRARQVGQEGVGVARLPAQGLQGGQTLQAPQVVQVQVHLGNGLRGQKVAADANGRDLHFRVLLLLRVFGPVLPVLGLVMPEVGPTVPWAFRFWLRNCTLWRLKQDG